MKLNKMLLLDGYTATHIFILRACCNFKSKRITKKELTKTLKTRCRFERR